MAAPASHRLDLLVLPPSLELGRAALEPLRRAWEALPGGPVEGGCAAVAIEPALGAVAADEPGAGRSGGAVGERAGQPAGEPLRFVGNRQGGFRVRCPDTGVNLVPRFNAAVMAWRDHVGDSRALDCPCGRRHDLASLDYQPPAGFARAWIVLRDVASAELRPEAAALVRALLGGEGRVVFRRG